MRGPDEVDLVRASANSRSCLSGAIPRFAVIECTSTWANDGMLFGLARKCGPSLVEESSYAMAGGIP